MHIDATTNVLTFTFLKFVDHDWEKFESNKFSNNLNFHTVLSMLLTGNLFFADIALGESFIK